MKKVLFALLLGLLISGGVFGGDVNKSASANTGGELITSVSDPGDGGVGGR